METKVETKTEPKVLKPAKVNQQRAQVGAERLAISDAATVYGCCGLFDLCGDADLMSLSFAKTEPFLDWLGWEPTKVCEIRKNFITWERPAYSGGNPTADYVADACADGYGVEWGECDFLLDHFGRLRRVSPVRDITKVGLRLCENQPRYRLDGTQIMNDDEYDMRIVTEVLMQGLKRRIILGNHATPGDMDGLNVLINNGYTNSHGRRCSSMDSIVIDMNGNGMNGGAGMTWNGAAIAATYDFIDILLAVYRRIRQRIQMAGGLSGRINVGDMVLVAPTTLIQCILNAFTCWSVCDNSDKLDQVALQSLDGRKYRDSLNGGMFGAGRIFLDGFEIPLIAYDWALIKSPTLFDAFLLTNQVGGVRLLQGQYNDMRDVPGIAPEYEVTDGGRLLTWTEEDNTCYKRTVEMQPRILAWAPWAQARFIDVQCNQPGGTLSPDPLETSFFPETSFSVADCPP